MPQVRLQLISGKNQSSSGRINLEVFAAENSPVEANEINSDPEDQWPITPSRCSADSLSHFDAWLISP